MYMRACTGTHTYMYVHAFMRGQISASVTMHSRAFFGVHDFRDSRLVLRLVDG